MKQESHILLTICILLLFPDLYAQPDLSGRISVEIRNSDPEYAIREIGRAGNMEFSYSSRKINMTHKVTILATDRTIASVLDDLCRQLDITYLIIEDHIVLKPVSRKQPVHPGTPRYHTLSGYIRDSESGEVLIGATVYISAIEKGTISNEFGFYSLTLPPGLYDINYSFIGYETFSIQLNLVTDQILDIHLDIESSLLEEVTITTADDQIDLSQARTGNMNLEPRAVERMPAFMGEQDVIKSLDAIPGINLQGEGSTLFFVRGGNKDQNLILLDDAPIYNPAHFLGLFSTFIPEAVKDINIYKGDIPAEFGGRLSSLIDVRTKDGDMNRWTVNGSFGLIAAKASVEGPVSKEKSSFFISGRSSYIKWYLKSLSPDVRRFNFYDVNAKFNFRMGLKDRLHLSGYAGKDYFSQGKTPSDASGISWGNVAGTLRWNHIFNEKLFSNTTIYGSKYDYYLITDVENNDAWNSNIANVSLKSDFTWYANPDINLRFGGKITKHDFNPGNFEYGTDPGNGSPPVVSRKSAREKVLYISNNHVISPEFTIRYGMRLSSWQNTGEATEYTYEFDYISNDYIPVDTFHYNKGEKYKGYMNLEPRIGMTFLAGKNTSLKASYARTAQYLQLVTNSISPFTTLEVWLPSSPNIKPQTADQVSIGFFRKFPGTGTDLSIEGFYKKLNNQIDYEDHAHMLLNPHIESELRYGTGKAYGLEILLKKYRGKLNGWLGYSLSHTERTIDGINNDEVYPASWDRPHDLSLYLSYNLTERWTLSVSWIYMSGSAFSSPTGFYRYNGYTVPIYDKKNNDRLPAYHRLDLSTEIRLNKREGRFRHNLSFTVYNLYSRKNPFAVNFNKKLNENGIPVVPGDLYLPPELVPTQIYLFGIVPAICYSYTIK